MRENFHTHRKSKVHNRWLVAGATALLALGLSACSTGEDQPTDTATEDAGGVRNLTSDDARTDQKAVGAGAERAASFGFEQQAVAADEEISAARDQSRQRQLEINQTTVEPAQCKSALSGLDWSPMLIDTENITRIDYGSQTFAGTGTIEVAQLGDTGAHELSEYQQHVDTLVNDCQSLDVSVPDPANPDSELNYTFTAKSVADGILWSRAPKDSAGEALTALVLTQEVEGHAVMVSFAGDTTVQDDEFKQMAQAIIDSTAQELGARD